MGFLDSLFSKIIKSEFIRARILAFVRTLSAGLGAWLVSKGLADQSMTDALTGLIVGATSFYLADLDVHIVDGKIKVALLTPTPEQINPQLGVEPNLSSKLKTTSVEVHILPPVK